MANGLTTKQEAFVAAYLGPCRFNATRAAEAAGYTHPNKQGPALLVNLGVQAAIAAWREEVKQSAITDVSYRVSRLAELESRLWGVVDARQDAYKDSNVIGGDTGLVVLQRRQVGQEQVEEFVADVAVAKAIQSVYDDVAKEMGQRVDKVDVSGSMKREYVIVRPGDSVSTETAG